MVVNLDEIIASELKPEDWTIKETFSPFIGLCHTLIYNRKIGPNPNLRLDFYNNASVHVRLHEPGAEYWHQFDLQETQSVN